MTETTIVDRVRGTMFGLDLPTHTEVLRSGGPEFLTSALRASGVLGPDNNVTDITDLDAWALGDTGMKGLLSIAYKRDAPGLSRGLFVKFSRNGDDPVRDGGRRHMPPEVRPANVSRGQTELREVGSPIPVITWHRLTPICRPHAGLRRQMLDKKDVQR